MWIRLDRSDLGTIVHYSGMFVVGVGLTMLVPLVTALATSEWDPALDYVLGVGVALVAGLGMMLIKAHGHHIKHNHALMIAALSWLSASLVAAVPLAFSGNYLSYLDAVFDAMSGLTTSGLTVVVDLDHMAHAHNMWRHFMHLIGGQGIIVAALSLAVGMRSGAFALYQAEGRDEKVRPNVIHTARFIWFVTGVYVAAGTVALGIHNLVRGMEPLRSLFHAFWIVIAAYDTGGFAPQSTSALYYHSWVFEGLTVMLMLAGTLNFSLHAAVWRGGGRELLKDIETRTLAISIFLLSLLAAFGLSADGVFTGPSEVVRKGLYHVISAHTGTGHQTLYASEWLGGFSELAWIGVVIAMALGGGASSTAGGIKALRVGLLFKTLLHNIREAVSPRSAIVQSRYRHIRDKVLTPELTMTILIVFTSYIVSYVTGAIIGVAYGYPFQAALFESVSATANVGLSMGVTSPYMETGLKLFYILQMWIGRLEFIAVLALVGHLINAMRPKEG